MSLNSRLGRVGMPVPESIRRGTDEFGMFVSWFLSTLNALIPSFVRNSLLAQNANFEIWFDNETYYFEGTILDAETVRLHGLNRGASDLLLNGDHVAVLRREIPGQALSKVTEIMNLKADAETPFNASDVNRAVRVLGPTHHNLIAVELALITKARADKHRAALANLGIELAAIDFVSSQGERADIDLNDQRHNGARVPRFALSRLLMFGILGLTLVWMGGRYVQKDQALKAIEGATADYQNEAQTAQQARLELSSLVTDLETLERRISEPAKFQSVYQEVTRAVSDKSWIQSLTYSDRSMTLTGLSAAPERLISELNASPLIEHAEFTSSLVKDARRDAERFRLEIQFVVSGGESEAAE